MNSQNTHRGDVAAGRVETGVGEVPRVSSRWGFRDWLGALRVRLGIARRSYRLQPGLYAVGEPTPQSPVMVSANYKLSFDHLRRALAGRDAWILVLDTRGINVWCAAGKGTFGSDELVERIESAGLKEIVSHRVLIVPQLGAPGISAPLVEEESGFRVVYGPVRAGDLPAYLDSDMEATPRMRSVDFPLLDRLLLTPVELRQGFKYAAALFVLLALLGGFHGAGYTVSRVLSQLPAAGLLAGAGLAGGAFLTPALLPWLPGRSFTVKGGVVGLALGGLCWLAGVPEPYSGSIPLGLFSSTLVVGSLSAFLAMKFTGSTPYTSLSGVEKEVRYALPAQSGGCAAGVVFWCLAGLL